MQARKGPTVDQTAGSHNPVKNAIWHKSTGRRQQTEKQLTGQLKAAPQGPRAVPMAELEIQGRRRTTRQNKKKLTGRTNCKAEGEEAAYRAVPGGAAGAKGPFSTVVTRQKKKDLDLVCMKSTKFGIPMLGMCSSIMSLLAGLYQALCVNTFASSCMVRKLLCIKSMDF